MMLVGKKVALRPLEEKYIEQLRQWRNRSDIRAQTRITHEISEEEQKSWYQTQITTNKENAYHFTIHSNVLDEKQSQSPIGYCALTHLNHQAKSAEFSIYLGDLNSYGKGYGSDALRILLRYGFEHLQLNKIWGEVFANNPSAFYLYIRVGFTEEGRLRQHHYSETNKELVDVIVVGMLWNEWEKILSYMKKH